MVFCHKPPAQNAVYAIKINTEREREVYTTKEFVFIISHTF